MIHLALWIASALFIGYVSFIALGLVLAIFAPNKKR
jgi:hypothetical protein